MGPNKHEFIVHVIFTLLGLLLHGVSLDLQSRHVLDLIQFINTSAHNDGFTYTSGQNNDTPAILLEDSSRNISLPETVLLEALQMLQENSDITFLANIKQDLGDAGTVMAFSSDILRFLEIESSGRRDEIRFHYTHDQQTFVETFPYRLADNEWHKLAITLSGTHLTLLVDCSKIYERVINSVDRTFTAGKLKLFVGQRNGQHALFRGALQDVKIVTQSHGYLLQCPEQDTDCPTCAQYQVLEQQVKNMYSLYQNLSKKLLRAEERISDLEKCECSKSCVQNGTTRKEGEEWQPDACTVCLCRNGSIDCRKVDCPPVTCQHPVYRDGECCPACLTNCYYSGKYFDHGEAYSPRVCVACTCDDGRMECKRIDPKESCPPLNCPDDKVIHISGECCPICEETVYADVTLSSPIAHYGISMIKGTDIPLWIFRGERIKSTLQRRTDFCGKGHNCHDNATCVNLATRYACQCKMGFQGDGVHCEDIDECQAEGGKLGHHCNGNTKCVNTIGSYTCRCASGHTPSDPYSCEELDECALGTHICDKNAECKNTAGSYSCICKDGYKGDGSTCVAECTGLCLNGGKCVAPNVCECRHGYIGLNCELDIDECAIRISSCHGASVCINTPGWYHCDCIEGFHSTWPDNHYGSLCMDINECIGEGKGHTCHPSTKCVNTEGTYRCDCQPGMPCVRSCMADGKEQKDNSTWKWEEDQCMDCVCKAGVTTCHKRECDCDSGDVDYECCPHCDKSSQCKHQEVPIMLENGERWIFQCQTCECLNGEIDCWPLTCPRTTCQHTIQEPGDCCPRCVEDNPCTNQQDELGGADNSASTCLYQGHTFSHGENWVLRTDPCASCECKAGHICCLFNQTCTSLPHM